LVVVFCPSFLKIKSGKIRNMRAYNTSINPKKFGFKEKVVVEL